jgi:hypothetical protein
MGGDGVSVENEHHHDDADQHGDKCPRQPPRGP